MAIHDKLYVNFKQPNSRYKIFPRYPMLDNRVSIRAIWSCTILNQWVKFTNLTLFLHYIKDMNFTFRPQTIWTKKGIWSDFESKGSINMINTKITKPNLGMKMMPTPMGRVLWLVWMLIVMPTFLNV